MRNAPNLVGGLGSGCLAVSVFQENTGSLPRVVVSLCHYWCGLVYRRCRRGSRPVAFCLAEIELFYWPSDCCNTVIGSIK